MEELIIDANVEKLEEVLAFIEPILELNDVPMKSQIKINVAVEEIFVNIANYAYDLKNGTATIRATVIDDPKALELVFIDNGMPFNPLEKLDPDITLSAEERQIGGLGIYMVKKNMDDMRYEYRDNQNILTLIKFI